MDSAQPVGDKYVKHLKCIYVGHSNNLLNGFPKERKKSRLLL